MSHGRRVTAARQTCGGQQSDVDRSAGSRLFIFRVLHYRERAWLSITDDFEIDVMLRHFSCKHAEDAIGPMQCRLTFVATQRRRILTLEMRKLLSYVGLQAHTQTHNVAVNWILSNLVFIFKYCLYVGNLIVPVNATVVCETTLAVAGLNQHIATKREFFIRFPVMMTSWIT